MAVFTPVTQTELEQFLTDYDVGDVVSFTPIAQGIENTNYFLTTTRMALVLTLFERLMPEQLPFYLELMRHLSHRTTPCPAPQADRHGALFGTLNEKPAALVTRLSGRSVLIPTPTQCEAIGRCMAQMHLDAQDFAPEQRNQRGFDWWRAAQHELKPHVSPDQRVLLIDEVAHQEASWVAHAKRLPAGAVHADLFRDNVLFDGDSVGGVIDFYFAATEPWLFDLAVAFNDWCVDLATGAIDAEKGQRLLAGYAAVRAFRSVERHAWADILRAAALRFWLSRLHDHYLPRAADLLTAHDPAHFERILRKRRDESDPVVPLPQ